MRQSSAMGSGKHKHRKLIVIMNSAYFTKNKPLPGKTCANEPAAEKRLQVAKFQEAIVLNQHPAPACSNKAPGTMFILYIIKPYFFSTLNHIFHQ